MGRPVVNTADQNLAFLFGFSLNKNIFANVLVAFFELSPQTLGHRRNVTRPHLQMR